MVLVHGVCSTGHDYHPLVAGLRRICQSVIVMDMPGHGKSGIHVDSPDFDTLVDSVVDVIQHSVEEEVNKKKNKHKKKTTDPAAGAPPPASSPPAAPPKVFFLGNSLGGLVAIRVVLKIPHRIAGLALLSPAGAPLTEAELTEVKALFALKTHQDGLNFIARVVAFPEAVPRFLLAIMSWACRMRTNTGEVQLIMSKASPSHMLTKRDLRGLKKIPTLFIWGKHERVLHAKGESFFRRHLPSSTTVFYVDEAFGHVPFLDDRGRVLEILEKFFRQTVEKMEMC